MDADSIFAESSAISIRKMKSRAKDQKSRKTPKRAVGDSFLS